MTAGLKHHTSSNQYLSCVKLRNTYCEQHSWKSFFTLKAKRQALLSGTSVFCLFSSVVVVSEGCKRSFPGFSTLEKFKKQNSTYSEHVAPIKQGKQKYTNYRKLWFF